MRVHRLILLGACLALPASAACFTGGDSNGGNPGDGGGSSRTCNVKGSAPKMAPGGYYTNGANVCTAAAQPHLFRGVDRPSLEFESTGDEISAADFQAMASWHANVVRIATNQDFWLSGAALYSPTYEATVDRAVHEAEAAGLDVILDLHWSDQGNLGVTTSGKVQDSPTDSDQQYMADVNSKQFWSEVAAKYKGDGHVLFELYNEPNGIPWETWLNGGSAMGYQIVGMQELYDTVRAQGADNLVIAGGLSWAFDLSEVAAYQIQGYNVLYATHPYSMNDSESEWPSSFGYLASGNIAPVIATEFGSPDCMGSWDSDLIQFAETNQISWTAWAWFPGGCAFPSLLNDWAYAPSAAGAVVKAALLAKNPVPVPILPDAGAEGGAREGGAEGGREAATDGPPFVEGGTDGAADDAQRDGARNLDGAPAEAGADGGAAEASDAPTGG